MQGQQSRPEIRTYKSATGNPQEKDRRVQKMSGLTLVMQIKNVDSLVFNWHVIKYMLQEMYVMQGMEPAKRKLNAEGQLGPYSNLKKTYAGKTEA